MSEVVAWTSPLPIGGVAHARATVGTTPLSLGDSIVVSFSTTNGAIASVAPTTAGGGKNYGYKVIIYGHNGSRWASAEATTADGADDLSLTGPGKDNLVTLTGAIPGAAYVEFYRTTAGGATTSTTGYIGTVQICHGGV
jgi:hypothetical protein